MGRATVPPTNGAADPYGPAQGSHGWVWRRDGWFTCLGRRKETHKKKRETWCVGHKWSPFSGNIDVDVDDIDNNNLLPRIGKRNDGCDETKTKEEETVADSVAIHTTIKQITGRGGGRWRQL